MGSRYEESFKSRNSGGNKKSVFDWSKLDKEVSFFKPKEGSNAIDIIPYTIKNSMHPLVKSGAMKIGGEDYMMDIFIHARVGPAEQDVICPKKNYNKHCPICDAAEEFRKNGQDEEYRALKAKRVCFYNVVDQAHPEDGVKVWNVSYFLFEKNLIEEANDSSDDGKFVEFADVKHGKTVKFRGTVRKIGTNEFLEFTGFKFLDREDSVAKYMKEVVNFDELITLMTPDQLSAILTGDEDEGVKEADEGKSNKPTIVEEKNHPENDDDDVPRKNSVKVQDDANPCPSGYVFGKDFDTKPECDDCSKLRECYKKSKE